MRTKIAAAMVTAALLSNTAWAQVDLGGTISGAINGATGGAQQDTSPKSAVDANAGANLNTSGALNSNTAIQGGVNASTSAATNPGQAASSATQSAANATTNAAGQAAPSPLTPGVQGSASAGLQGGASTSGNTAGSTSAGAAGSTSLGASGSAAGRNQNSGQGWLGRVGNDIRSSIQQAENGAMRLQDNLNPSLQQYGFRAGDQLLDANGQPLTQAQFDQYLQSNPNQVRVLRNGQTVVLNGNMQGNAQFQQGQFQQGQMAGQGRFQSHGRQRFGITMNPANAGAEGVLISGVTVGSPAAQAGLRPGDQIIAVNGQAISNPNAMIQLVSTAAADQALDVQFRRNGQVMQSQVMLAANNQGPNGVYQAGYAQGYDNRASMQGGPMQGAYMQGSSHMQGGADIHARLDQLERNLQELREEIRGLKNQ